MAGDIECLPAEALRLGNTVLRNPQQHAGAVRKIEQVVGRSGRIQPLPESATWMGGRRPGSLSTHGSTGSSASNNAKA